MGEEYFQQIVLEHKKQILILIPISHHAYKLINDVSQA